jgi:hypothetical protein
VQINLFKTAKRFFEPDTLIPFLIGTMFLSVTGNAFSDILKIVFGDDIQSLCKITASSIIIFIICIWLFDKALNKPEKQFDFSRAKPKKHKGLILLVSREEPCRKAIEYHLKGLKYCWLIHSSQSLPIVETLRKDYPQITFVEPDRLIINDVFDPIKFASLVREIYDALPSDCGKEEIIADFTGMTAQGSVGMAIASLLQRQTKLQYTPAATNREGKPTQSLEPIEIIITEKKLKAYP